MIPVSTALSSAQTIDQKQQPSYTWGIDWNTGKINKMVDGLEAIKQTVYCILNTERFEHIGYSINYGSELRWLLGKSPLFVESELERCVNEALKQDDRIIGITDFKMEYQSDSLLATFIIITQYGNFEFGKVVS